MYIPLSCAYNIVKQITCVTKGVQGIPFFRSEALFFTFFSATGILCVLVHIYLFPLC